MIPKQCPNGHYYDPDKYLSCPHCATDAGKAAETVAMPRRSDDDNVTQALGGGSTPTPPQADPLPVTEPFPRPTPPGPGPISDDPVTIGAFKKYLGTEPAVGWLVCVKGIHLGKDFRLKSGKNFIGRDEHKMDVALTKDLSVSRECQAVVVFEPRHSAFFVQSGEASSLCYLNGELVSGLVPMKKNDLLEVGDSVLMLIPCCDEAFQWPMEEK